MAARSGCSSNHTPESTLAPMEGTGMTTEQKDREVYETPKATVLGKVVAITFGSTGSGRDRGSYRST
ncbi:MAG: hypothetical protein QOJ59_3608 [Thermomicrobiales bacterium]|jgi:hypothetical protein|nr:hypothetical protein [Thermomicrobiales bacterium]